MPVITNTNTFAFHAFQLALTVCQFGNNPDETASELIRERAEALKAEVKRYKSVLYPTLKEILAQAREGKFEKNMTEREEKCELEGDLKEAGFDLVRSRKSTSISWWKG